MSHSNAEEFLFDIDVYDVSDSFHASINKANLRDFCHTELFEVVLANAITPDCEELLEGIIQANKNQINQNLVFITKEDIFELVTFINKNQFQNFYHPPQFVKNLKELCAEITELSKEKCDIPTEKYAQILKHQLINKMCALYIQNSEISKKFWNLDDTLEKLRNAKNTMNNTSSSSNKKKSKRKKALKKNVKPEMNDDFVIDTSSTLPNDSDELKDHICFYVLAGFKDAALLKMLQDYLVPINCVLQISKQEYVSKAELDNFWKGINEMSESFKEYRITEDIIHMKYVHKSIIPNLEKDNFFNERLIELADLLMEIPQLKRKHFQYIKHLYPLEFEERELKYGPFPFYEANLEEVAMEYVTIPYIVSSIIEEVENNLSGNKLKCRKDPCNVCQSGCEQYLLEYEITDDCKNLSKHKCPMKLSDFKNSYVQLVKPRVKFRRVSRKFHGGDDLNKVLTVSKKMNNMVLSDFKVLSNQKLLDLRRKYENSLFCGDKKDYFPFGNKLSPSVKKPILTKDQIDHFLNLLCLNNMKFADKKHQFKEIKSEYLCTGAEYFDDLNFLPDSVIFVSCENLFERFDSMLYRWIEPLPTTALVQRLHIAQQEYSNCNYHYCNQTNTLLVYFHHNLSPAGTRSRIWRESLRTIPCLRDFCNFYIFEDSDWLSKNPPVEQVKYEQFKRKKDAYFFQRLIESENPYREYNQYLIPYRYCGDANCHGNLSCSDVACIKIAQYSPRSVQMPNLQEIIAEIKNYPPGNELKNHCPSVRNPDTICSFDQRQQRFGLTGSTHEFFSHDGVKIQIDTCRFHFEDFKLNFSMEFDRNIVYGHFRGSNVNVHVVLGDGTMVKFYTFKKEFAAKSSSNNEDCQKLGSFLSVREAFNYATNVNYLEGVSRANYFEREVRAMMRVYENEVSNISESTGGMIFDDKSINTYTKILKYLKIPNKSYKFVHHKTKYLTTKFKNQNVPYSSVITQILKNTVQQEALPVYHRRVLIKHYDSSKIQKDIFSIKITLPNGLMIEYLPSMINNDETSIKQMHLEANKFNNIKDEDYRLFFNNGLILIRCSNGNMKILDAQGTIVVLKEKTCKPYPDIESKKCFQNIEKCRKRFYKLKKFASSKKTKVDLYSRSRRGHLRFSTKLNTSQSNILRVLNECNLPFTKIDLLSISGNLYKIRQNIVNKKVFAKIIDSYDFLTHEIFRQRTDGMKLINKINGRQIAIFPDGTKITKTMTVEKELQFFRKRDKEGWVIITIHYLYEHPYYSPIEFKNDPKITLVHLKENTSLSLTPNNCDIIFNTDTTLKVSSKTMDFKKICSKCKSECTCKINIHPVNFQESTEKYEPFLIFEDSYNKQFTSDFQGRCKISTDFIHGELNKMKCNHFSNNDYQMMFLLHGDLSGDLLWNDKMVLREIEKIKKEIDEDPLAATFEEFTTKDNSMTSFKFIRNTYVGLSQKYLWPKYLSPAIFSNWSDTEIEQIPMYQVYTSIFNMVQKKDIVELNSIFEKSLKI